MALKTAARAIVAALALAGPFALAADAAGRTVTIQQATFSPTPLTINVGDTVAWQNLDSVAHTATSDNGAFPNSGPIPPGSSSTAVPFLAAGTYAYHCSIHFTMHGTITVQAAATPTPPPPTPAPTPAPTAPPTPQPTAPPAASPTPAPTPSPSATASPSPSVTATPAPPTGTPISVPTSVAVASPAATSRPGADPAGGPGSIIAAGALVVALGLGGLAFYLYRRR